MNTFTLVVFGSIGLILELIGFSWLVVAIRRHPHLLRIKGRVVSVETKSDHSSDEHSVSFFPVISFTTPEGKQVSFRSTSGASRPVRRGFGGNSQPASPWSVGQSIDVFHDPRGILGPCIASLWSLYGGPLAFIVAGILLFIVVANKMPHAGGQ